MSSADDPAAILDQVKPVVDAWGVDLKRIELASHSENIVYRVYDQSGTSYGLRIHRPGYHSLAALNSEQAWAQALGKSGIRVPRQYVTTAGEYFASVDVDGEPRYAGLLQWLEGNLLSDEETKRPDLPFLVQQMERLGAIAATMHNQASSWHEPVGFTRHSWDAEGLLDNPHWGNFWEVPQLTDSQRKIILSTRDALTERLRVYGRRERNYSMIHADLHNENVMISNDEMWVLDFDDAGHGWHMYDIAVAIFFYLGREDFPQVQDAILTGYRRARSLSDADLEMLPFFLLIRSLVLLGWVQSRWGDKERIDLLMRAILDQSRSLGLHNS